jgi:hypothetical protein
MVRPLVVMLATALLAACTPLAGSPGASASPTALALTPRAAGGPAGATLPPVDASCRFAQTSDRLSGGVFVAVADSGSSGIAFVLDAETGAERGRLQIAAAPEMAVDWTGRRLLTYCGSRLIAYDLATLAEEWSVPGLDRLITKAPGGLPALAVSDDGKLSFELHYQTLRSGDANAPGASRTWLVARDPASGNPKGEVDLGDCGAGRMFAGSVDSAYVLCRDGLHAIDTATWTERRTYPFSGSASPVGLVRSGFLYGVMQDMSILSLDLRTGVTATIGKPGPGGAALQGSGRLTVAPYGETVWVLARRGGAPTEFDPDTLTAIDLSSAWRRTDISVAGLRGVGLVGARVVYGSGGRIRSTDGAFDLPLLSSPPEYWHIFGAPKLAI